MRLCLKCESFLNCARAALCTKIILIIKTFDLQRTSNPRTDLNRPCRFQEFEAPIFHENRGMEMVSSWAPRTWHAFVRIMSMKNSNDPIGNRTRDLPAVPQLPSLNLQRTLISWTWAPFTGWRPIVVDVSYIQIIKNTFASHMFTKNSEP